MDKVYIVVLEIESSYHNETEMSTWCASNEALDYIVQSTSSANKLLKRVFTVNEFGNQIEHYEVKFDGYLKLVAIPQEAKKQEELF